MTLKMRCVPLIQLYEPNQGDLSYIRCIGGLLVITLTALALCIVTHRDNTFPWLHLGALNEIHPNNI